MSDKKHIDRLFQEKFKGFESTPSPSVWENISKEIHPEKKRRKVIPIWWKIAGIAASLFLLFSLGSLFYNNDSNPVPVESIVSNPKSEQTNQEGLNQNNTNNFDDTNSDKTNNVNQELKQEGSSNPAEIFNPFVKNETGENSIVTTKKEHPSISKDNIQLLNEKTLAPKVGNAIVQTTLDFNSLKEKEKTSNKVEDNLDLKELNKIDSTKNSDIVIEDSKKQNAKDISQIETDQNGKSSLTDALATVNENEPKKEDDTEKNSKWSVSPNIAPVYFNTLGSGSSIHEQFNNNSKTGEVNMSYGVSASYTINKKISVRTGVHKVNLGYSTNNVVVYDNVQTTSSRNSLKNIDLNKNGQSLSFISAQGFNFAQVPSIISNLVSTSIDQELGFIEVPLELQYNISNNKLGISFIGGVSALILSDNNIYAVQEGRSTLLGEATNVNNTSYSANLGLGLDYKISKKVNLNLEPVFKYQLNTFNNTSGNFKPYFIGVYTGFSFKF